MPKMIWSFRQSDYIARHNLVGQEDGVCLALAARWAKLRLKRSGKALEGSARTDYFDKAPRTGKSDVHTVISGMQAAYDDIRVPSKAVVAQLDRDIDKAFDKYMLGEFSFDEYSDIKTQLEDAAVLEAAKVTNALEQILARQKLRIVGTKACNSFQEYFADAKNNACYVFKCQDLNHAFAGFFTKGTIWDNYWFFDPNSGEIYMDGRSEMEQLMAGCIKLFGKNGYAERFEVTYSKT